MKKLLIISLVIFLSSNVRAQKKEKTHKVLAACGQCQLDMNSKKGCSLAVQMAGKKYWVEGRSFSDFGDEHADDGLCRTIRKAEVQGTFKDDIFTATSFHILPEKKKKKK